MRAPGAIAQLAYAKVKQAWITELEVEPATIDFEQVLEHRLRCLSLSGHGVLDLQKQGTVC
jgi:hypothetical protein